jgi:hypothetical protein
VTLTQAHAAFHPAPALDWLNLPGPVVEHGRQTFRHRLTNVRSPELVERVAAALTTLGRLYAGEPPGQTALDEAIASGGLVLTENPPAAYWDGTQIPTNWSRHRKSWRRLLALARRARVGAAVEELDIYDEVPAESAMPTLFARLRALVPASLHREIRPGSRPRSYRLTLPSNRVHIIPALFHQS